MTKEILPQIISGYKVIKKIGRGSFSDVYLVEDKQHSGKTLALKKILKPQWTAYIEQEINALNIISKYPYSPKLLSVERNAKEVCLIMDYIPGQDIRQHIKKQGTFSQPQAFDFLLQILPELEYIHQHNILHLDIKMTNIMRFKGHFCLIDWGISQQSTYVKTLTLTGGLRYMPPETFQGFRCPASEIYSLGCVLYYCLSKKYLFGLKKTDSIEKKIYACMNWQPSFNFPITDKLKYLLLRMLEKDPLKRATIVEIECLIKEELTTDQTSAIRANKEQDKYQIPDNTFAIYEQMANAKDNNLYAQYRLGLLLEKDRDKQNNMQQAIFWHKKSAVSGYALAQHRLGFLYYSGHNGVEKNFQLAFFWFTKAAYQNYKRSQYFLGKIYEFGKGVKRNQAKAVAFYALAVKNSDIKAEDKLKH